MNFLLSLAILVLVAIGLYEGIQSAPAMQVNSVPDDNMTNEQAPPITQHIEPTNTLTWPSGDRVWDCCRAIAFAEGYHVSGSNPARLNNPGDISDGRGTFGSEFHSGSNITRFPDAVTGWQWLYTKVARAASGKSTVYDPSMSWREIGAIWAPPNAEVWASNVAGNLGVDSDSSLGDYING
jgi:hypothetical protein